LSERREGTERVAGEEPTLARAGLRTSQEKQDTPRPKTSCDAEQREDKNYVTFSARCRQKKGEVKGGRFLRKVTTPTPLFRSSWPEGGSRTEGEEGYSRRGERARRRARVEDHYGDVRRGASGSVRGARPAVWAGRVLVRLEIGAGGEGPLSEAPVAVCEGQGYGL